MSLVYVLFALHVQRLWNSNDSALWVVESLRRVPHWRNHRSSRNGIELSEATVAQRQLQASDGLQVAEYRLDPS